MPRHRRRFFVPDVAGSVLAVFDLFVHFQHRRDALFGHILTKRLRHVFDHPRKVALGACFLGHFVVGHGDPAVGDVVV